MSVSEIATIATHKQNLVKTSDVLASHPVPQTSNFHGKNTPPFFQVFPRDTPKKGNSLQLVAKGDPPTGQKEVDIYLTLDLAPLQNS